MKKSVFIIMAAAMIVAACASEESNNNSGNNDLDSVEIGENDISADSDVKIDSDSADADLTPVEDGDSTPNNEGSDDDNKPIDENESDLTPSDIDSNPAVDSDVVKKCGNGSTEAGEQCDDGNTKDGDGCSSTCQIEAVAGTDSCFDINTCMNSCEDDESCQNCIDSGDAEGQALYSAALKCVEAYCQDDMTKECQQEFCSEEVNACLDDNSTPESNDPRIDLTSPYSGDTLLVINVSTDGDFTASSGTLPAGKSGNIFAGKPVEGMLINPVIQLPEGLKLDTKFAAKKDTRANVGDTRKFWTAKWSSSGTEMIEISGKLLYSGTNVDVWAQTTSSVTTKNATDLGTEFDNNIYGLVTKNFYTPSDYNGDTKIAILIADIGQFAAGYFFPGDLLSTQQYKYSNQMDMICINTYQDYYKSEGAYSTITHEFQHLVHNNRNVFVEGDKEAAAMSYRFIDEGLAQAASDLYLNSSDSKRIEAFNLDDQYSGSSIRNGQSLLYWEYQDSTRVLGNYALSYLFFQYLRIQAGNDTTIFRKIIEDENNDYKSVENVIKDKLGIDFVQAMINFRLALLLNDSTGIYGFGGEEGFDFTPHYFSGTSTTLHGGGAFYKKISSEFTKPANAGSNTIYIGVNTK